MLRPVNGGLSGTCQIDQSQNSTHPNPHHDNHSSMPTPLLNNRVYSSLGQVTAEDTRNYSSQIKVKIAGLGFYNIKDYCYLSNDDIFMKPEDK